MDETVRPEYFDELYAKKADPWEFETSTYEAAKYAETLAILPRQRYRNGLEIGCSIGVLTAMLAEKCERLMGIDVAEQALARARERCEKLENVRFAKLMVPGEFPEENFDLVVVSEVAYYWSEQDFANARDRIAEHQEAGGHLLLVHWIPAEEEHVRTGDVVHEMWLKDARWRPVTGGRREKYWIDLLERG